MTAALAPVAAEAAEGAATRTAGSAAAKGKTAGAGRKAGSGGTPTKQQQIDGIQAIKDRRKPEPDPSLAVNPVEDDPNHPARAVQAPAARPVFQPPDAVSSGSGFVLGLLVWVVGVNYLRGGVPQVKKLLTAKFLNKTGA